jgi:hypothetical protein
LLASGIDCTNARDGTTVAVYCAEDDENRVYVREINEFMDKFQAEPLRVPPYADTLNPEP